jgi:hypothetical protein
MLSAAAFYRNSFLSVLDDKGSRPQIQPGVKFRAHRPRVLRMVRRSRALSDATGGTIGEKMSGFHFPIDYL